MGRPLLSQQLLVWWKEVKDGGHNKDGYTQTYLTKKRIKKAFSLMLLQMLLQMFTDLCSMHEKTLKCRQTYVQSNECWRAITPYVH